jgi:hypothetical protein
MPSTVAWTNPPVAPVQVHVRHTADLGPSNIDV